VLRAICTRFWPAVGLDDDFEHLVFIVAVRQFHRRALRQEWRQLDVANPQRRAFTRYRAFTFHNADDRVFMFAFAVPKLFLI
jgi:hypothetical protein